MDTIAAPGRRYRISEVSRRTGFTPTALRYYESAAVLAPPERTAAGYRVYDDRAIERLRLVARAKDLGCTLEEITGLVEAWDADDCGPVKHRLRSLVSTKVTEIERHIAEQHALATELRSIAATLTSRPVDGPCDETCGCSAPAESLALSATRSSAPPIACTLTGDDVQARIEEWQVLLEGAARERIPDGLRFHFPAPAPLSEIARLAEAEHGCCAFFTFVISVDASGVALDVTAPADGQPMIDTVFGTTS